MLLLAAAIMAAPQLNAQPSASANCPRTANYYAWQRGKSVKPRTLTELPGANLYKAVYRRVGGCEAPVVVKYGIGHR